MFPFRRFNGFPFQSRSDEITHCALVKAKVRGAVIGASGYAGEELVRLLLTHPHAELAAMTSWQFAHVTTGFHRPMMSWRSIHRQAGCAGCLPSKV
jgi:hypothetical protein